jgi:hypothetical protein
MSLIDEQIEDARRKGHFDDLPGAGKPLKLDDDSHTPEHLRMAHKLMRDNNIPPEWVTQGKELDAAREQLAADVRRALRLNQPAALAAVREAAAKYNRQVLSYNLKVPQGITHKPNFDIERELRKGL